jgi:pimeloyl-ACP methyl ester carboxylesterase
VRKPLAVFFVCLLAGFAARAMPPATKELIDVLFRPFLAEQVTLSPDGRHVAYTEHVRNELHVVIMKLEEPYPKVTLVVDDDDGIAFSKEKQRATLRFLRWATPNRLVFAPAEQAFRGTAGKRYVAPVLAVDADGKNPRKLTDSSDYLFDPPVLPNPNPSAPPPPLLWRSSEIAGFFAGDRDHVLIRALGYEHLPIIVPTTAFKVNVHTGKKTELESEYFLGAVGYDQRGVSRINYMRPLHSSERSFGVRDAHPLKFTEAWLGPLAGRFTVSPQNYFGERAFPLGFDVDPNVLYIASNVGRDTFGIYALNLKTKQRTDLALEDPHVDLAPLEPSYPAPQLVFDEARGQFAGVRSPGPRPVAVWHDPELAAAQRALEKKFPHRTVEILEWSDARTAFLLRVTGGTEPGRYFVWQKAENLPLEILRRAPWLNAAGLHPTEFFEFDTPEGIHLSGYLTLPRASRLNPPPAVICFADGFPAEAHQEFDREAQVIAAMGIIVIRLNHRGVGGFGIKHRDAILAGVDRVPVDDAVAALDWINTRHPIDRRRVATMGASFGGYLAVRALQLQPDVFRCAVAFNAPLDPGAWLRPEVTVELGVTVNFPLEVNRAFLERGLKSLAALSVLERPQAITHPVFLLLDPARNDAIASANLRLRDQLKRLGGEVDYVEVKRDFAAELPGARTSAYEQLEQFFNDALYDYKVKIGESKVVK